MPTTSHHVTESCIASVSGGRVLAVVAGVVMVNVAAVGATVVRVVLVGLGQQWLLRLLSC